ncbi:hypothetical protein [Sulfitobacter sp. THAF37]|uniref:hypothetical protein n=1 Tax=Sulfitobacter sp. THAF37 TaxID=2587855 RepID=UPI00126860DF|nr:hypothetical protein [Sulfitobacter sp. THAF37]
MSWSWDTSFFRFVFEGLAAFDGIDAAGAVCVHAGPSTREALPIGRRRMGKPPPKKPWFGGSAETPALVVAAGAGMLRKKRDEAFR